MKEIAIYGAGGFGREVACLLKIINAESPQWDFIGFFDDGKIVGDGCEYGKVLGGMSELNEWKEPLSIAIAIGSPKTALAVVSKISNSRIDFPNIIAPDCKFYDKNNYSMGKGNIISLGCCLSCNVHLGDFNVLNGFISIGHDAKLGSYNSLMPGTRISGFDKIGDCNYFGASSVVLQHTNIGNNIVLGAGSVLMKAPKEEVTYIGNPARIVF